MNRTKFCHDCKQNVDINVIGRKKTCENCRNGLNHDFPMCKRCGLHKQDLKDVSLANCSDCRSQRFIDYKNCQVCGTSKSKTLFNGRSKTCNQCILEQESLPKCRTCKKFYPEFLQLENVNSGLKLNVNCNLCKDKIKIRKQRNREKNKHLVEEKPHITYPDKYKKCRSCKSYKLKELFVRIKEDKEYSKCKPCRLKPLCKCGQAKAVCNTKYDENGNINTFGILCINCKLENMIDVTRKLCSKEDCIKRASFGSEENKFQYCSKHQGVNMINFEYNNCFCGTRATYGISIDQKPTHCKVHKLEIMISIYKRCKENGCINLPTYNIPETKRGIYCNEHKKDNMIFIRVRDRICKFLDASGPCEITASYNFETEHRGIYCKSHKLERMVYIGNRCQQIGCEKLASYCNEGETPKYCKPHKLPNMKNYKKSKNCIHPYCGKNRVYNYEGLKPAYCVDHKKDHMIDMYSNYCSFEEEKCYVLANFNFAGKKAKYCNTHKQVGMINVRNNNCISRNCKNRARYNITGNPPRYCFLHRQSDMLLNPNKYCDFEGCKNKSCYGINNPLHCEEHKEEKEIDLRMTKCTKCGSIEVCNSEKICYEYCIAENIYKKYRKLKELTVLNHLQKNVDKEIYSYDKTIDTSCSLHRPDIVYDCGTHMVIIEVDEYEHNSKTQDCEISRMKQITYSYYCPCVFIRYNPDNKERKGKNNLKTLSKYVNYCLQNEPKNFLSVIYIFYQDYEISKTIDYNNFINIEVI